MSYKKHPNPGAAACRYGRRAETGAEAQAGGTRPANIDRVLRLQVPVIVRLAERCMPLTEILNLTSGAIIEFSKPADAELDLLINNKCIGHGRAVKVGENFGLRIMRVGSVQDRIDAMRG